MTRLLPDLLFPGIDFGLAELCAARLDGELTAVDAGFSPVDHPETMALRLQALAPILPAGTIVERQSALWAYGFRLSPPLRHEACVRAGAGRRVVSTVRVLVRQVVLHDDDVVDGYAVPVTSMVRTAVDLVRSLPRIDREHDRQLRSLLAVSGATLDECLEHLDRRRNLPNKTRAAGRLRKLFGLRLVEPDVPLAFGALRGAVSAAADAIHVVHGIDPAHGVQNAVEMRGVAHLEDKTADRQAIA